MGKLSEDYEKDPRYWTQFDETIDSLHIEKVVLANHKTEENRIKDLLLDAAGRIHEGLWESGNALIQFSWYHVYHFLKFGYLIKLEYFETNSTEELLQKCNNKNYDGDTNLCILEYKENADEALSVTQELGKLTNFIGVVNNEKLNTQYRFNYLFRE